MRAELAAALIDAIEGPIEGVASAIAAQIAGRWPPWVEPREFARYVAARIEPGADPAGELGELHAIDLYLACACARGIAEAHGAFERDYVVALPGAVRTIDGSPHFVDDVVQLVREKLLVADPGPPRIEAYSGHGPLGAFLRVTAIRLALSLRRRKQPAGDDDELAALIDGASGADVQVLARRLGADLREALRAAIAKQEPRMRSVMRMYYADGHGVEDIGRVYRVHASSVSRWLARTRAAILAETRAHLVARLVASESEVDSLLGHAVGIEISLGSILTSRSS